ncbi:hypothetical protein [Kaarinaea lacus]
MAMHTKTGVIKHFIIGLCVITPLSVMASNDSWQFKGIAQSYYQSYNQSESREAAYNLGVYLIADYLESFSLSAAYNYTFVDMTQNTEVDENLLHAGAKYSWFSDALSGKLSLAMDIYGGKYTTSSTSTVVSGGGGGGMGGMGGMSTISRLTTSESTDITVLYPQASYINFARTLYFDIGYAYSEYDSDTIFDIDATQITPTIGFGWNESFDWLQLRGYFINLDQQTRVLSNDDYTSAELKYIHWFEEKSLPYLDNVRLTLLAGDRAFAVDPDTKAVYSLSDKQTGAVSVGGQWKLSQSLKLMLLAGYEQYENEVNADEYNSFLIYGNLQSQW